jgi:hypothetical protein
MVDRWLPSAFCATLGQRGRDEVKPGCFRVDLVGGQGIRVHPPVTSLEWPLIKGRGLCHHDPLSLHNDNSPRVCGVVACVRLLRSAALVIRHRIQEMGFQF